jgi:hypothetical protein
LPLRLDWSDRTEFHLDDPAERNVMYERVDLFAEASAGFNFTQAADHDPGFDHARFAEALAAIDRLPDRLFRPYGMSPDDTSALRERMRAWARRVSTAP